MENLPRQLLQEVEEWQEGDRTQQSILEQFVRSHYEHVNVVLVYFGDVNFNLFRHD